LPDTVLESSQERPIKVSERSGVSEDGIQRESDGLSPELGKTDIITELKLTKEFTESVNQLEKLAITPLLIMMSLKRTLPQWEDSHITEKLKTTMLC